MALVLTTTNRTIQGVRAVVEGTLAFDSSYPTGGEPLSNASIGLQIVSTADAGPSKGYVFEWDGTNNKMKVYQGDNTNAAAAPLIEVANTTDLSTLTAVKVRFTGA